MSGEGRTPRPRSRGVITLIAAILFASATFWAGLTIAQQPTNVGDDGQTEPELYEVSEGTVERSTQYGAQALWESGPTITAPVSGVITTLNLPGDGLLASGDIVYTLDLMPVVAIDGQIPAFRSLSLGTSGDDVTQLQDYLKSERFLQDDADGVYGASTEDAVRTWQAANGMARDGVVDLGEIVFAPLPARAYLADQIYIGTHVSAGSPILNTVVGAPSFSIVSQSDSITTDVIEGLEVQVIIDSFTMRGTTGTAFSELNGTTRIPIVLSSGAESCTSDCMVALPIPGPVELTASVIFEPERTGPLLPTSALRTRADGSIVVHLADGEQRIVNVLAADGGLAVVSEIAVGDMVRLFGEDE